MRSRDILRWGITCLLLAPLAVVAAVTTGWWAFGGVALALVVVGAALNLWGIARGVKRANPLRLIDDPSGDLQLQIDRDEVMRDGLGRAGDSPRQRIIFPPEPDPVPDPRRRAVQGGMLAAGVLAVVAFGAWMLVVEHPSALGPGLTLDEIYGLWGSLATTNFTVQMIVWIALGVAGAVGVALLGVLPRPALDRLLSVRRFSALACIVASAAVVAAWVPYFSLGISLADDLPLGVADASVGSTAFGLLGIALSAAAIVLTVPSWWRAPRD